MLDEKASLILESTELHCWKVSFLASYTITAALLQIFYFPENIWLNGILGNTFSYGNIY